jgi:hypothetical protein
MTSPEQNKTTRGKASSKYFLGEQAFLDVKVFFWKGWYVFWKFYSGLGTAKMPEFLKNLAVVQARNQRKQ